MDPRRTAALRDIVRAQRQVANAFHHVQSASAADLGRAMEALEDAHATLDAALADFYTAAEHPSADAADDADALRLRRLHAAVEALERRATTSPGGSERDRKAPATGTGPPRAQPRADEEPRGPAARHPVRDTSADSDRGQSAGGAAAEAELQRLIEGCARDIAEMRSELAESPRRVVSERLSDTRLGAVEDRLAATETRLRILERYVIER
jgi:hypothetical protein